MQIKQKPKETNNGKTQISMVQWETKKKLRKKIAERLIACVLWSERTLQLFSLFFVLLSLSLPFFPLHFLLSFARNDKQPSVPCNDYARRLAFSTRF